MRNFKRLLAAVLALLMMLTMCACGTTQKNTNTGDGWVPTKNVTFYLYSGAGGDTDTAMRALASYWQEKYGVAFNVVNMPGGAGGIAANYVYDQPSDGYTLFGMADGVNTMNVLGAFEHPTSAWEIMVLFGGVGCIGVPSDSPYQTIEDLVDAAKSGAKLSLSCSSTGSVWHVEALQFENSMGIDLNILTYDGSNQAVVGALSGEVDIVCSSLGEQSEYIKSGDIRPLAVLTDTSRTIEGYEGEIPAITATYSDFDVTALARQWNGVGIKADAPAEVIDFYKKAFQEAIESGKLDVVKEARNTEYIGLLNEDARAFINSCDSAASWTLWDIGVATVSPEEFNIAPLN